MAGRRTVISFHPFRHLGLKLLAVGLGASLWFAIAGEPLVERGLQAPLEFQNVPEGLEIVGGASSTVDVRVRGTSAALGRLEQGDIVAVLDLASARSGERLLHLSPDQVRTPFGVAVAQVSPSTIHVALDRSGRRYVRVAPTVEGKPAAGFVVGSVSSRPASVEVAGPMRYLVELAEVMTETISVADASATVRETVAIGVADRALRLNDAQTAQVTVEILPAPRTQVFDGVEVLAKNPDLARSVTFEPSHVTVHVRGSPDALRQAVSKTVQAVVDLAGMAAGRYTVPVHVTLGQGVSVDAIDPTTIEVLIR